MHPAAPLCVCVFVLRLKLRIKQFCKQQPFRWARTTILGPSLETRSSAQTKLKAQGWVESDYRLASSTRPASRRSSVGLWAYFFHGGDSCGSRLNTPVDADMGARSAWPAPEAELGAMLNIHSTPCTGRRALYSARSAQNTAHTVHSRNRRPLTEKSERLAPKLTNQTAGS